MSETDSAPQTEQAILNPRMGARMRWALVLVVLFAIVAVLANQAVWVARTALSTDQFVETFAPLPEDPAVARALGDRLAERLFDEIAIEERLDETLPPALTIIIAPIGSALEGFVADTATDIISSDAFAQIWETTLRVTHTAVLTVVEGGERGIIESEEGTVSLDLSGLVERIDAALAERGIDIFGEDAPAATIVLYQSGQIALVDQIASLVYSVRWIAPITFVLLAAGALALGTNRRRVAQWLGVALVIAMVLTLIALRLLRNLAIGSIVDPTSAAAADGTWDIIFDALLAQTAGLLVFGAVVAIAAWIVGPSARAVSIRTSVSGMGADAPATGVVAWVGRNATTVQWGAVALGALILLIAPQLTGLLVLVVAVIVALVAVAAAWAAQRVPAEPLPEPVD